MIHLNGLSAFRQLPSSEEWKIPEKQSPPQSDFRLGTAGKIALVGYGTSLSLDVIGGLALGAKSLLWQRFGVAAAFGTIGGLAFTTGLLAGRGIDFLPTLWGEEKLSTGLGIAMSDAWGPAPSWLISTADFLGLG